MVEQRKMSYNFLSTKPLKTQMLAGITSTIELGLTQKGYGESRPESRRTCCVSLLTIVEDKI
jgi:hypothetical protein